MGLKDFEQFSAEEIGLWLTAQGLGDKAAKFVEEGVDGDLLCSLTIDDLKNDLDLSGLQAKKVLKNIEFSKNLKTAGESEGDAEEAEKLKHEIELLNGDKAAVDEQVDALTDEKATLEEKIQELEEAMKAKDDEVEELKKKMEEMKVPEVVAEPEPVVERKAEPPAPAPAPKPAPQSHNTHRRRGAPVIGGAARGAAGGAVKGAIAGAILPGMDAGDGAAAGAAVGAFSGGVGGFRGRRRGRFGR